jgi:hypothetical protein
MDRVEDSEVSVKWDSAKERYDLIPAEALHELAKAYSYGAVKYGDRNWEKRPGLKRTRIFAAIMRHAWAWMQGEERDPESGLHHMAQVAWGALALIQYHKRAYDNDDRPLWYYENRD